VSLVLWTCHVFRLDFILSCSPQKRMLGPSAGKTH
jgi:hypothetical protein